MARTLFLQHTKMFNLDDTTNENNEDHNKKMAIYFKSSIQNLNNWRSLIRKNKCIA